MVRVVILFLSLLGAVQAAQAQTTGSLEGSVKNDLGEPVPNATITIEKQGELVTGTFTDYEGIYNFSNLQVGVYDVIIYEMNYYRQVFKDVTINPGRPTKLDYTYRDSSGTTTGIVEIFPEPIVKQGNTTGGIEVTGDDMKDMGGTTESGDVTEMAAGVNRQDEGRPLSANGGRFTSNMIYIDGIPAPFGSPSLSVDEILKVQVITSGIPARYGDATGAITNIITKGAPTRFIGRFEAETSQFLDAFAANNITMGFGGPIAVQVLTNADGDTLTSPIMKISKTGDTTIVQVPKKRTILGYRFSGRYETTMDPTPSAIGSYRLSDDKLADILANPMLASPDGQGTIMNLNTVTEDDIVFMRTRPNARQSRSLFTGKLVYAPSYELNFTAGTSGEIRWGRQSGVDNRLVNAEFNPVFRNSTWRSYGRMRHIVKSTLFMPDSANMVQPVFQNLSYTIQADYSKTDNLSYDPRFKEQYWNYGYVGEIRRSLTPVLGEIGTEYIVNSNGDTLGSNPIFGHAFNQITFDGYTSAGELGYNDGLARYNNPLDISSLTDMEQLQIINGRFTGTGNDFFGLHNNAFATNNGYNRSSASQFRATVESNFDLYFSKSRIRHAIQVGGVYEQRVYRSYNLDPFGLWNLADQTANSHISNAANADDPITNENGNPVMFYDPLTGRYYEQNNPLIRVDANGQATAMSAFGENVRAALGKESTDWVNVHEMRPEDMNLEWFEATTLIQGSQQLLDYYGYDYLGNPIGTGTSFNDFFTKEDANGRKTRPVAPFAPIYVAGYIQDQFRYKDMIFNLGMRFDSYDANTKVLRDPYSVTGLYTASEFENPASGYDVAQSSDYQRPSNIGDDYAVYVTENSQDASVVGYRNGEQWYNRNGVPVNSPTELGTTIIPALKGFGTAAIDPQGEEYDPNAAFRDYTPSVIVMPRISFAFPIGEMANFYANYDVLAMRPPEATLATPLTYFNFRENADLMANPNLKPQRTINYEVGYEQALSFNSRLKFSMLYREERDLIQARQYILAYPITYTSFANDDFSTAKMFKVEYELRPGRRKEDKNKHLRIIANYTLGFAEGTGSNPTSSLAVAADELKYIFPLDFDQRHSFYSMINYNFLHGKKYKGPKIGRFELFGNMGINLTTNLSSGQPYTRKELPRGIGTSFQALVTDGSINGARLPWNFRVNLRINRSIVIGKHSSNPINMNVYLRVRNLFNTMNVLDAYPATGDPLDDGFLTMQNSPGVGLLASRPEVYQMLYNLRMRDPDNVSLPRRIILGATFSF